MCRTSMECMRPVYRKCLSDPPSVSVHRPQHNDGQLIDRAREVKQWLSSIFQKSSAAAGSTFVAEPYYREYFADGQNYVQTARSIYGGGGGGGGTGSGGSDTDNGQPNVAMYEGRLGNGGGGGGPSNDSYAHHNNNNNNNNTTSINKNTPVYAKAVTAAGLTVDLPSPDSGIGADAITPRDQNNIQQVHTYKIFQMNYARDYSVNRLDIIIRCPIISADLPSKGSSATG